MSVPAEHAPLNYDAEAVAEDYQPLCRCGNFWPCDVDSVRLAHVPAATEVETFGPPQ